MNLATAQILVDSFRLCSTLATASAEELTAAHQQIEARLELFADDTDAQAQSQRQLLLSICDAAKAQLAMRKPFGG